MTDPRWTPETAGLVEAMLPRIPSYCPDPQCGDSTWDHDCQLGGDKADAALAERILTALAGAGLLLPPGGEVREEWAVTDYAGGGPLRSRTEQEARNAVFDQSRVRTRSVHTGPWRPVDPQAAISEG